MLYRPDRQILTQVTCDNDDPFAGGMLEDTVTPGLPVKIPSFGIQPPYNVTDFHCLVITIILP